MPLPVAPADALPRAEETHAPEVARTRREPPTVEQAVAEGRLVLVVDDHPINRLVMSRQVSALGYANETAENGREALERWASGRYRLVITDVNMPEMDGYQLSRAIRAKELAGYPVLTKSGIIVGLGETNDEVVDTMRDLRANGVDVVTIGQYLQPSPKHAEIDRWVHPDEFRWFREQGEALGFGSVFSGPLVRSSYRADEQRHAAETGRGAVAY